MFICNKKNIIIPEYFINIFVFQCSFNARTLARILTGFKTVGLIISHKILGDVEQTNI